MFKYIENLRQKPEKIRRQYAFGISLFIVLLIAGLWVVRNSYIPNSSEDEQTFTVDVSPIKSLFSTLKNGYGEMKEKMSAISWKTFQKIDESLPETAVTTSPKTQEKINEVVITDPEN